jgi:hypothetical protein
MTKIPSVEEWKLRVEALHPTSFCNAHDIDEVNWEHDKKGTIEMIEEALTADRLALLTELTQTIQAIDFYGWNEQTQSKIKEKVQAHLDELIYSTK